jgi:hypothetical protein
MLSVSLGGALLAVASTASPLNALLPGALGIDDDFTNYLHYKNQDFSNRWSLSDTVVILSSYFYTHRREVVVGKCQNNAVYGI